MCYGMSKGAELWLAYEKVEKNNIKGSNVGFLHLSAILAINFIN